MHCTVPYFGFKAKPAQAEAIEDADCTVPYFGFKAKLSFNVFGNYDNCTVPYFGFKAKQVHASYRLAGIVLCLILDSRQNYRPR